MSLEETLALKRTNLEKLIRNADEAIRNEILKYEKTEFYIRLQSECFNLYPVVVKALALQIAEDKRRSIFCSIVKGHKLEHLAAFHKMTPEEVVQEFCSIVCELRRRINNGAFTVKESVNLRLMKERNSFQYELWNCKEENQKGDGAGDGNANFASCIYRNALRAMVQNSMLPTIDKHAK